jgi:hypothetical protein
MSPLARGRRGLAPRVRLLARTVWLACAAATGCFSGTEPSIPCATTANCPTGYSCDGQRLACAVLPSPCQLAEISCALGCAAVRSCTDLFSLARDSGDGQRRQAGATLPSPLVVKVTDANGSAVQAVTVSWGYLNSGASITPTSSVTNQYGKSFAYATLGPTAGAYSFTASAGTSSALTTTFTAQADPAVTSTTGRTIAGTFRFVFNPDSGALSTTGFNLTSDTAISALVPTGTAAGYDTYPGALGPDRTTFSIPNVPTGTYFLSVALDNSRNPYWTNSFPSTLVEFTTSTPTFTYLSSNRPNLSFAPSGTPVALDLTGLTPVIGLYTSYPIQILSSQAQVWIPAVPTLVWYSNFGTTAVTGTLDWSASRLLSGEVGMPEAAKGDVVWVTQQAPSVIGPTSSAEMFVERAVKYARLTDVTVQAGVQSTLTASLLDAPQSSQVTFSILNSEFAAMTSKVSPSGSLTSVGFQIAAMPHAVTYPRSLDGPEATLVSISTDFAPASPPPDWSYGAVDYGHFLDSIWSEFAELGVYTSVSVTAPGATTSITLYPSYFMRKPFTSGQAFVASPQLSPPSQPLLNGADAFLPQTGVGLQPTFTWSPPSTGSPTSYSVSLYELYASAGNTMCAEVGSAVLVGRSFTLPPGWLKSGRAYAAVLSARSAAFDALDADGFLDGYPFVECELITAVFQP